MKEPSCPSPALVPKVESRIDTNFREVIEYSHALEDEVACYKEYFKEINK